jgi:hypothetical protein
MRSFSRRCSPAALALDHARLYEELKTQATATGLRLHEDVVEGSAAAIASTDGEGRFTSVNPPSRRSRAPETRFASTDSEILPRDPFLERPARVKWIWARVRGF